MGIRKQLTVQIGLSGAVLIMASVAFAQFRQPAGKEPATANPLPLSGRTGQSGLVTIKETPVPGATTSVNTINPTVQVEGPYAGSTEGKPLVSSKLSLREAVERGLRYNLGAVGASQVVHQGRGQSKVARSALLPSVNGSLSETLAKLNLRAQGFHFNFPGFSIPSVVGPFNFFDLRASLSQTVLDLTATNNYRSAKESLKADEFSVLETRDLVVFAVGGAYLQVIAATARVQSARAQLDTANTLYQQVSQQREVGLAAQIDVNRSRVQMLTQQQRLKTLENDLAKQKINLARIVGFPPSDQYDLSDTVPSTDKLAISEEDALKQALGQRSDLKAAQAQVRASERALSAARAQRLPSLSVTADYGVIGLNPNQALGTFTVAGSLKFPIWQGGRIEGDIEQAGAVLAQRQAELEDLRGQVEADVRKAYLDVETSKNQVEVARENIQVTRDNLELTRQRFDAGVSDNLTVVQSQESVATAELDYIDSVFAYNVAKLSLARAIGRVANDLPQFLQVGQQENR